MHKIFREIISLPNLFSAWSEFKKDKMRKKDVPEFALNVEEHLFRLHQDLSTNKYYHRGYESFYVRDPKLRKIHKASIIDRVLHHAIVRVLDPIFDKTFIFDSYSSRKEKGMHKAGERLKKFAHKLSRNNTRTVWILKCDIRKFFASINHSILLNLLAKLIRDDKAISLLQMVIESFSTNVGVGLPLGNLTSQLFSNIYLDALDQFIKRHLKVKHYIRYADDFIILSNDKDYLIKVLPILDKFLKDCLKLSLHPNKVSITKWHGGIDFLGFVHFPHHSVLRTKTAKRMIRNIKEAKDNFEKREITFHGFKQILNSYLGILKHCRGYVLRGKIINILSRSSKKDPMKE